MPPEFHFVLRYFWVLMLVFVLGLAAFWRLAARSRIAADPSLRRPLNRLYGGFAFWLGLLFLVMGLGILSGAVETIFHYMRLDGGNPYVTAVQLLGLAEDALFIWWVFFRGGDQLVALHAELPQHRPQARLAVRVLAVAAPLAQAAGVYQATFSPHFGQVLGA